MPTARREQIEQAVVSATHDLLDEGTAFGELGIERIATRAGISRTAFYFYFSDKRELLMRVTAEVSEQLFGVAEGWWSGDGDGAEDLVAALRSVLGLYHEHGAVLRAVVEASATDEDVARFWRDDLIGRFVEASRVRIEAEQAAGRVDADLPARGVAFALTWMTERTAYQHMMSSPPAQDPGDLDELVQALSAVWLGAVYGR